MHCEEGMGSRTFTSPTCQKAVSETVDDPVQPRPAEKARFFRTHYIRGSESSPLSSAVMIYNFYNLS